jgi:hypothetical protein
VFSTFYSLSLGTIFGLIKSNKLAKTARKTVGQQEAQHLNPEINEVACISIYVLLLIFQEILSI